MSFIIELGQLMKARKKFCLLPFIVMMVLFGSELILGQGSGVTPFIYTVF